MAHISDIKLIRTDTTLDLSQKAEKAVVADIHSSRTDLVQRQVQMVGPKTKKFSNGMAKGRVLSKLEPNTLINTFQLGADQMGMCELGNYSAELKTFCRGQDLNLVPRACELGTFPARLEHL
ncbi:hypothetical protein LguiB_028328 [Lonicera macranthoides]